MNVTFFGVRGSCPCSSDRQRRYGGNTSCVLVEVEGEPPLVLDLGTGLRLLGLHLGPETPESGPVRANVLLSHLHYDHLLGLPFFGPLRHPGTVLDVYGPAQPGSTLAAELDALVRPPFFPVRLDQFAGALRGHDVAAPWELALGRINVVARAIPHRGATLGYRIEADDAVLAYLPDHQAPADRETVPDSALELCRDADLVVHDAQYTDDEFDGVSDWGHSTSAYAVRVAATAGARRLALFHHDPSHSDDDVDAIARRAQAIGAGYGLDDVTAAAEGTTWAMGKG